MALLRNKEELNCEVNVVDCVMGSGKTSAIIEMVRNSDNDTKWIIICPYIDEVDRYLKECNTYSDGTPNGKRFIQPNKSSGKGSKREHLRKLINDGRNIVSTHALFNNFDDNMIDNCRIQGYKLIMDEVHEVVRKFDLGDTMADILLDKFVTVDEETRLLKWRDDAPELTKYDYDMYLEAKTLCQNESLACYNKNNLLIMLFPVKVFNAFSEIYLLTYLFSGQLQKAYFDFWGVTYKYMKAYKNDLGKFVIEYSKDNKPYSEKGIYKELINIYEGDINKKKNMNRIGDDDKALTHTWYYEKHKLGDKISQDAGVKELKSNLTNFFNNMCKSPSNKNLWTCYKLGDFNVYKKFSGKGYTKGFLAMNARATNKYRDRNCLAYCINRYVNPDLTRFFSDNNIKINENDYSLSEMLQWIWRGAIRNGEPINLYVPSKRMRNLLKDWIEENSL